MGIVVDPTEPAPTEPPSFRVGREVGNYKLLEPIGDGGQGDVFRAVHLTMGCERALKMPRGGKHATLAQVQLFLAEVRAFSMLDHDNVVQIHETGEHEGRPYFTMELVKGGSLDKHKAALRESPRRTAELMEKVARAVFHVHQHGILHRDLKPANILLDEKGEPHVTDFGVAKLQGEGGLLTRTGAVVGTPLYMPYEQAAGRIRALTVRADVYSMGVILYELLTGKLPYTGETLAEIREQMEAGPPEDPRALDPRIDRALARICLRCLEREPDDRYDSAEALAVDLRNYLDGRSIKDASRADRVWRWCLRRPVAAGLCLAAVSFLAILLPSVVWIAGDQAATRRAQVMETNKLDATASAGSMVSYLRSLGDAVQEAAADEELARAFEEPDPQKKRRRLDAFCKDAFERFEDPSRGLRIEGHSPFYLWGALSEHGTAEGHFHRTHEFHGERFDGRDYVLQARKLAGNSLHRSYVSYVYASSTTGTYQFAISTPVYGKNGVVKGILIAAVHARAQLGLLINDDGQTTAVLAAPVDPSSGEDPAVVPVPLRNAEYRIVRHPALKEGESRVIHDDRVRRLGTTSQGDKHVERWWELLGPSAAEATDDYEDPLTPGRRPAAFAPVGHTGFVVIVQSNNPDVMHPEKVLGIQLLTRTGIAASPGVLFLAIAAWYERRKRR